MIVWVNDCFTLDNDCLIEMTRCYEWMNPLLSQVMDIALFMSIAIDWLNRLYNNGGLESFKHKISHDTINTMFIVWWNTYI